MVDFVLSKFRNLPNGVLLLFIITPFGRFLKLLKFSDNFIYVFRKETCFGPVVAS